VIEYFPQVKGHAKEVKLLSSALVEDRVAGAYLFAGPPGIGKALLGESFARALNCEDRRDGDEQCTCRSCVLIRAGNHPDFFTLKPDGRDIKIAQVRELIAGLQLKPYMGRYKVVLIDPAETLNIASSNALLKTLEEPPPQTVIILVTSMPHRLLVTIRSRCQRITFQPLDRAVATEVIGQLLQIDQERAQALATLAAGSIGKALQLQLEGFEDRIGDALGFCAGLDRASTARRLDFAAELAKAESGKKGENAQVIAPLIEVMMSFCRDMAFSELGVDQASLLPSDNLPQVGGSVGEAKRWISNFDKLYRAGRLLQTNANRELLLDRLFLDLT
jgi:DNA polymerase III subunit delta'